MPPESGITLKIFLVKPKNCARPHQIHIIIIIHVYISPEPGHTVLRRCTVLLSLTQTCFHPSQLQREHTKYAAIKGAESLKHIDIMSYQVITFMDE